MEIRWQIPAQIKQIDQLIVEANQVFNLQSLNQRDQFALNILLREALCNAIFHGCHQQPAAAIECRITRRNSPTGLQMILEITDPGPGFDWQRAIDQEIEAHAQEFLSENLLPESGRGLLIYMKYATSYEFNSPGNQITLRRDLMI